VIQPARTVVVLDACVLVPATLRDTLLRAYATDLYVARWTTDILVEVERTLVSHLTTPDRARSLVTRIREAFEDAEIPRARYERLISAMTNHPKDRHVLAAAIVVAANAIVTSNPRDFPPSALSSYNIDAESPDRFLMRRFDLHAHRRQITPCACSSFISASLQPSRPR
jgi:hypothetical protein